MKLTDGGIETMLIFDEGIELPCFAAFDLLQDAPGTAALRALLRPYARDRARAGRRFVLESADLAREPDWGAKLGYAADELAAANRARGRAAARDPRRAERRRRHRDRAAASGRAATATAPTSVMTRGRGRGLPRRADRDLRAAPRRHGDRDHDDLRRRGDRDRPRRARPPGCRSRSPSRSRPTAGCRAAQPLRRGDRAGRRRDRRRPPTTWSTARTRRTSRACWTATVGRAHPRPARQRVAQEPRGARRGRPTLDVGDPGRARRAIRRAARAAAAARAWSAAAAGPTTATSRDRGGVPAPSIRPVSFAGKTAIVTGAATGIGAATAKLLAERGARVLAAGLQPEALRATVGAIVAAGGEAIAVDADVSDPAAIEALAAARRTRRRRRHPRQQRGDLPARPVARGRRRAVGRGLRDQRARLLPARQGGAPADARPRRRRDRQRRLGHVLLGRGAAARPTSPPRAP